MSSGTISRLAAMQAWPVFCIRPIVAALTVRAEVLGVEHDERVAAAELEHRLLQVLAGQRGRRLLPARSLPVRVTPCDVRVRR